MTDDSPREPEPDGDDPWLGLLEMTLRVPPDEAHRPDSRRRREPRRPKSAD